MNAEKVKELKLHAANVRKMALEAVFVRHRDIRAVRCDCGYPYISLYWRK